jgi:hypothetical protein
MSTTAKQKILIVDDEPDILIQFKKRGLPGLFSPQWPGGRGRSQKSIARLNCIGHYDAENGRH